MLWQLPTPALNRHDTAVVWDLRLHGEPGGPTSITGTARSALAIFYIVTTFLSGHTSALILARRRSSAADPTRRMVWLVIPHLQA